MQNLDNRLMEHNSGEGNFTAKCLPWALIWSKSAKTRGEAMKLEDRIKKEEPNDFCKTISIVLRHLRGGQIRTDDFGA
jgi:predicted GIY-YIG superfamily endonuclease